MDPADLIVGVNVRQNAELTKEFVEDVATYGVRTPITARRDPDGRLVVRTGQRRTLAAVEAGRRVVPVFVEPEMHREDNATATIDRIVEQLSENHHRASTPDSDQVLAHQQLFELGLSAGQIAKRTHLSRKEATVLRTVAASPVAAGMLHRHD
jgi:ParB family chromosome partitioning protein